MGPRARQERSSRKGGNRTKFGSLPVWRSRSSPGPFPLVHVRFDATIPSGARHASSSGRFPAAGSGDSSCEVRCAWCSSEREEVGGEGKRRGGTLPREPGNRRLDVGEFALARRNASLRAPFVHSPLASHSSASGAPGLRIRRPHHVTQRSLVKKCCAIFSSLPSAAADSLHGKRTAHPLRGRTRPWSVFPCIRNRLDEQLGHEPSAVAGAGDRRCPRQCLGEP